MNYSEARSACPYCGEVVFDQRLLVTVEPGRRIVKGSVWPTEFSEYAYFCTSCGAQVEPMTWSDGQMFTPPARKDG